MKSQFGRCARSPSSPAISRQRWNNDWLVRRLTTRWTLKRRRSPKVKGHSIKGWKRSERQPSRFSTSINYHNPLLLPQLKRQRIERSCHIAGTFISSSYCRIFASSSFDFRHSFLSGKITIILSTISHENRHQYRMYWLSSLRWFCASVSFLLIFWIQDSLVDQILWNNLVWQSSDFDNCLSIIQKVEAKVTF